MNGFTPLMPWSIVNIIMTYFLIHVCIYIYIYYVYLFALLFIYVQKSQVQGLWHLSLSSEVKGLSGVDFGLSGTPSPNFKTREVGNPSWTLKNQPIF